MKNLLSILFFFLALTVSSIAQTVVKYQDYASQGGKSATVQGSNSSNKFAQVYPSCTVTVYLTGTTTLATLYSDTLLTSKSNPFTATSEGYYEFFAIPGQYDIRLSGTGITTPFTRSRVELQIGQANVLGGTVDYIQLKSSSSALGDSPLYRSGGVAHGPTAASTANTTQLATTAYTRYQRGKLRVIATASLPSTTYSDGATVEDGDKVQLSDGNRATVTYRTGIGWVKDWTEFNVLAFDADNTGATNTQAEIQACIDAATAAGVLDVYVPAGAYKLTRVTDGTYNYGLKITNNIRLRGDGAATIFSVDTAAATRFVPILVQPSSTVNFVEFKDFVVDGNGKGQLDAGLIQVNNVVRLVTDGLELKEGGTAAEASPAGVNGIAISASSSSTTQQITIQNTYIHDTTKAAVNISTNAKNVVIENVRIKDITGNGQSPGLQINGATVVTAKTVIINDTEGPGIVISTVGTPPSHTDSSEINLIDCFVSRAGTGSSVGEGIKIQNANSASALMDAKILIDGCHIFNNGVGVNGSGIRIEYQKNVAIRNSWIYGNSSAGILFQSSQQFSVQGNHIYNNNTGNSSEGAGVYLYAANGGFVVSNGIVTENFFFNTSNQKYPVGVRNDSGSNFTGLTIAENFSSGHSTSDGLGSFSGTVASSTTDVYRSTLTDGRVPYRSSGRWTDSANLLFDGSNFDVAGQGIMGPKSSLPGNGGQLRFRDDTGTSRWLFGHGGSAGATSFLVYDLVNSKLPFTVTANSPDNAFVINTTSNTMAQPLAVTGNITATSGDLISSTAGKSLQLKTGSNACAGWATLSSGTVTVSTTCIGTLETDTGITLTPKGSSTGVLRISATTANTSFTITSTDASSSDKVYWQITKLN